MLALAAVLWTQGVGELLLGAGETGPAPSTALASNQWWDRVTPQMCSNCFLG